MITIERVQIAKGKLKNILKMYDWFRGIGISKLDNGTLCLKINVSEDSEEAHAVLSNLYVAVPIVYAIVGDIEKR